MVGVDGVDNSFALAVFFSRLNSELNMCTLLLVVKCLSDIVEKSRAFSKGYIRSHFRCEKTAQMADLK